MNSSQENLWIGGSGTVLAAAALSVTLAGQPLSDLLDIASPAFFPFLASLLIGGVSLSLVVQAAVVLRPLRPGWPRPPAVPGLVPAMALFVAYAVAIPWVGMWAASAIAVPALAWILGLRRLWLLALLAALPPWLVIRLFESALNILFPEAALSWSM